MIAPLMLRLVAKEITNIKKKRKKKSFFNLISNKFEEKSDISEERDKWNYPDDQVASNKI